MPWAAVMMNLESGKFELIPPSRRVDSNDPLYADEVHIVPIYDDPEIPNRMVFGVHDFTEACPCHPTRQEQVHGRTMILHREATN